MERKKSKHSIAFPTILDMGKFLGSKNDREQCPKNDDDNIYELRGILLHKGTSAYHGHYEAQVNDIEYVSIQSLVYVSNFHVYVESVLGSNSMTRQSLRSNVWVITYQNNFLWVMRSELNYSTLVYKDLTTSRPNPSQAKKNRINARKRQRIDSDDDDVIE